jgi:hypothetical protein
VEQRRAGLAAARIFPALIKEDQAVPAADRHRQALRLVLQRKARRLAAAAAESLQPMLLVQAARGTLAKRHETSPLIQ